MTSFIEALEALGSFLVGLAGRGASLVWFGA